MRIKLILNKNYLNLLTLFQFALLIPSTCHCFLGLRPGGNCAPKLPRGGGGGRGPPPIMFGNGGGGGGPNPGIGGGGGGPIEPGIGGGGGGGGGPIEPGIGGGGGGGGGGPPVFPSCCFFNPNFPL